MARLSTGALVLCVLVVALCLVEPAHAFGAGNIASIARIEGTNWRHGDIEDTLLQLFITRAGGGRRFSKIDVKRVYFGNWLRDYSQAVDVGTVKYVSGEAIRLILWILGFMSFGYGTREFEVTMDRLGCYRPEEHIDNPKDYADNLDARQYDPRLRGPVDERRELSIDERNGMKNYIASEDLGITTSAGMVRDLLRRCIQLARESKSNGNEQEMYEALRLLGTATHCMEDFAAHSNYIELCLIEMGERNIFPHVGSRSQIQVRGGRYPVFPLITGTFGGVDFLHSVCGEVSDKITQSEIDELEGTMNNASQSQSVSMIKNLLSQLPSGLFGDDDHEAKVDELSANSAAAQMQNMHISPKKPEAFTRQVQMLTQTIYPALEFHDNIMRSINEAIEQIPVLPDLIEQLQEQISIFVFSLIAPIIVPIIGQVKAEISTGSSEIIQSSKDQQLIVFNNDQSTDPTHSMLSKDHFTNLLNEPAGKVASQVLKWAIPQIVDCWDNPNYDAERTISRIINGVFHHPVLREQDYDGSRDCRMQMFGVVEQWWQTKDEREKYDFRDKLSRDGVINGRNHKEGLQDKGHGCGKPLGFATGAGGAGGQNNAIASALMSGFQGALGGVVAGGSQNQGSSGRQANSGGDIGNFASDVIGGGALGDLVGGLVGGVGESLLGGAFDQPGDERSAYQQNYVQPSGAQTTTYMETAHRPAQQGQEDRYGQAAYSRTEFPDGQREEYRRYEQDGREPHSGYGMEHSVETHRTQGGGYERREETRQERTGGEWASESRTEGYDASGEHYSETKHHSSHKHHNRRDSSDSDRERRQEKQHSREHHGKEGHGRRNDDDEYEGGQSGGYNAGRSEHGRQPGGGYGGEFGSGRETGYGEQSSGGRSEYGRSEYGQQGYEKRDREDGLEGRHRREEEEHGGGEGRRQGHGHRRRDDEEEEEEDYEGRRRRNEGYGGGYGNY